MYNKYNMKRKTQTTSHHRPGKITKALVFLDEIRLNMSELEQGLISRNEEIEKLKKRVTYMNSVLNDLGYEPCFTCEKYVLKDTILPCSKCNRFEFTTCLNCSDGKCCTECDI